MIEKKDIEQRLADLAPAINELPGDLSRLAAIIDAAVPGRGVDVTLRIAKEFRATYIYCHSTDALKRSARDRLLIELYNQGAKVPALARAVSLSERRVWKILGKEPVDDRQGRLF